VTSPAPWLRSLLQEPGILVLPDAVDVPTARLVEEAGVPADYAIGAGIANAPLGLPGSGLATRLATLPCAIPAPLVANMTERGKTPPLDADDQLQGGALL
jgi:2-methylisocitrate lyase-like PEP mutase family enzyme